MKKKEAAKKSRPAPQHTRHIAKQLFIPDVRYALIATCIGFILYVNTVANGYVLDDAAVITGNQYVMKGISGIPALFTIDIWHFLNLNLGYYRPLSLVTFAIENQFFPGNPHVSHLVNVVLYALTGFFLCMLLMRVFKYKHPAFAWAVTVLFLAHPVHTEVVANIKSRDEILSFLNLVISLYLLLLSIPVSNDKKVSAKSVYALRIFSCFFFYLALLSKETALAGVLLVPALLFFDEGLNVKKIVIAVVPFVAAALLFQVQKYELVGSVVGTGTKDIVNYPYADAALKYPAVFMLFAWCIKLILFPYPLSYNYAYDQIPVTGWGSAGVLIGVALVLVLIYLAYRNILYRSALNLGIIILGITLAPALGFVLLRGGIFAERFLYAPVLGFSIVLVWGLISVVKPPAFLLNEPLSGVAKKWKFSIPVLLILLVYSAVVISRNADWKNNLTLYAHDAEVTPNSCQVHLHYGAELLATATQEKDASERNNTISKAFQQLYLAKQIYPNYAEATYDMGWAYQKFGLNNDSAIYYLNLALLQAPDYAKACFSLGSVYESMGKQELASYYYNKGVSLNPYDVEGVRDCDRHRKLTGLDVRVFPSSQNKDPLELNTPDNKKDFEFYNKMGAIYGQRGDLENAVRCLENAVALNPTSAQALVNLSICYGMMKNYNKSIEVLNKMLAIYPNDIQALRNLAASYEAVGDKQKMRECVAKIKQLGGN